MKKYPDDWDPELAALLRKCDACEKLHIGWEAYDRIDEHKMNAIHIYLSVVAEEERKRLDDIGKK